MKRTAILIATLAALNVSLAGALVYQQLGQSTAKELHADHIGPLHVDVQNGGLLHVPVGDTDVILTPHAAVQLHYEMGQMFALIEKEAADGARGRPSASQSPDQSL